MVCEIEDNNKQITLFLFFHSPDIINRGQYTLSDLFDTVDHQITHPRSFTVHTVLLHSKNQSNVTEMLCSDFTCKGS